LALAVRFPVFEEVLRDTGFRPLFEEVLAMAREPVGCRWEEVTAKAGSASERAIENTRIG
jgi:hypothetical protein